MVLITLKTMSINMILSFEMHLDCDDAIVKKKAYYLPLEQVTP